MTYNVILTKPFKRSIKKLKKRYPHVQDDTRLAVKTLLQTPQLGVVIPRSNGIRKLRVRNRDAKRGKSGGYRLLYYLEDVPSQTLYLLLLYAKSDRANVSASQLERLLAEIISEADSK